MRTICNTIRGSVRWQPDPKNAPRRTGYMVRSTIFWIHLVCGVATGLVVLMMSVTGVILTYERQMLAWADRATFPAPTADARRLTLEELVDAAKMRRPEFTPTTIMVRNEPD